MDPLVETAPQEWDIWKEGKYILRAEMQESMVGTWHRRRLMVRTSMDVGWTMTLGERMQTRVMFTGGMARKQMVGEAMEKGIDRMGWTPWGKKDH